MTERSSHRGNPVDIGPHLERTHPCGTTFTGDHLAAAKMEEMGDLVVSGEGTPPRIFVTKPKYIGVLVNSKLDL